MSDRRAHTLQLPKPHSNEQRIIMQAFNTPGLQEIWCPCGTKFGKSLGWSVSMASAAWSSPNKFYRWVAPIYKQAKIGLKYHLALFPANSYLLNKSDPSITLQRPNNSRIEYTSGKFPEDLEGEGITGGYGFDEAAKMPRQVYESASTTVALTRALMAFFSTPKGKGWFYHGYKEALADMNWHLKRGLPPKKIAITAPTSANPFVPRVSIEDARKRLPDRLFRQYYEAEFLDDGSVFVGFRNCIFGAPIEFEPSVINTWIDPELSQKSARDISRVVIGADWAKLSDYTVFIAIDYEASIPKIVGYCRFQGLSYLEAIKQLIIFSRHFDEVTQVKHDKTGLGVPLDDMLSATDLAFEGITFGNANKSSMVADLMLCFERGEIRMPNIQALIDELDIYEVVTNSLGTARYAAPQGQHDDIVSALILAYLAVKEFRAGFEIRFVEDLPDTDFGLDQWYAELTEDLD